MHYEYISQVPHEVKNQRAKTTSQIMKNGQDLNIQMRSGTISRHSR